MLNLSAQQFTQYLMSCLHYATRMMSERHKYVPRAFVWLVSLFRTSPVFELDFQMDKLHKLIDTTNPAEVSELEFVERMARPNRTIEIVKLAMKLWVAASLMKMVVCCYFMLIEYKIISMESRLVVVHNTSTAGRPLYSFACLASNCSSLFDPLVNATRSRLIMDELPVLPICQPFLSKFNETSQSILGTYSMLMSSFISIIALILQSQLSKIQTRNPLLLFLVAPNISRRLNFIKTKMHVEDLSRSFAQYQLMIWIEQFTYYNNCSGSGGIQSRLDVYGPQSSAASGSASRSQATSTLQPPPKRRDHLSVERHRFVYDCFPFVRFERWRRLVSDVLLLCNTTTLLIAIACPVTFIWLASVYLNKQQRIMAEFMSEIDRSGCSIWHKRTNNMIDITGFHYGFNLYGLLSTFFVLFAWPMWSIMAPIEVAIMVSWELRCLVCELKYKIIMLLPVIKNMTDAMLCERAWFESGHRQSYLDEHNCLEYTLHEVGGGQQVVTNEFNYGKLREKFAKDVWVIPLALINRPFLSHQLRLETQAFIMNECLDDRFKSAVGLPHWPITLAELLEKLYVEFRILDDLFAEADPGISVITGTGSVLCYLVFLISLLMFKLIGATRFEQCLFMSLSLFCAIFMTLNSAILRSKVSCRMKAAQKLVLAKDLNFIR
jgi:hypothetical protein